MCMGLLAADAPSVLALRELDSLSKLLRLQLHLLRLARPSARRMRTT